MSDLDAIRAKLKSPVKFKAKDHSYHLNGKKLINVGSLTKRFKEPFDSEYWAAKKAKERGVKPEVVLAEWAAKGRKAASDGTAFHNYAQFVMTGKGRKPAFSEAVIPKIIAFDDWWAVTKDKLVVVACEVVLHSTDYGICGTTDIVAFSNITNRLHILDWKTNEKFATTSDYNKWLLNPFAHLPECALSEYSLQVGLYKLMAEWLTGEKFGDSYVMHVGQKITPHKAHNVEKPWLDALKNLWTREPKK